MARRDEGGLNKPAKQPKNEPVTPKPRSSLVWPEGRNRPLPTVDRDLARRLARSPMDFEDLMPWIKGQLELDPPDLPQQPSDIEIPGSENCGDVFTAIGGYTIAQHTFTGSGSYQVYPTSVISNSGIFPLGAIGNLLNGWALQMRWVEQVALNPLANGYRVRWEFGLDFSVPDETTDAAGQLSRYQFPWDTQPPFWAPYSPTEYNDSGWITTVVPSDYATFSSRSSNCDQIVVSPTILVSSAVFGAVVPEVIFYFKWIYDPNAVVTAPPYDLSPPADTSVASGLVWDPDTMEWVSATSLPLPAYATVRVNSGGSDVVRTRINVIEGTGVDVSVADDSGNDEIDLTVAVDPAEISITSFSFPGGSTFLRADGTFVSVATEDRMNAAFSGEPIVGGTYPAVVPRGTGDVDITIDLERFALRLEVPASSGDTVAVLQKATGGGAPTWSDVATCTIAAGSYEATEQTIGGVTVTSGDLLRLYFTSVGAGADYYTGTVTGTEV